MKAFSLFLLLLPFSLAAQTFPYSSVPSEKALASVEDIAASIFADSFNPMTHFKEGEREFFAVPAALSATRLLKSPEVEGRDFFGSAFGLGAAWAAGDDVVLYALLGGMGLRGDLEYAAYGDSSGAVTSVASYTLVSFLFGAGYDLYRSELISIPVYFGFSLQYFDASLESERTSWAGYDVTVKTMGNGMLAGVTGGIAVSLKLLGKLKITPYYLYIRNFTGAEMEAEVMGLPIPEKHGIDVPPLSAGLAGLGFGFASDSKFSFSLSAGTLLSSLLGVGTRTGANGVRLKSLVLVFSCRP